MAEEKNQNRKEMENQDVILLSPYNLDEDILVIDLSGEEEEEDDQNRRQEGLTEYEDNLLISISSPVSPLPSSPPSPLQPLDLSPIRSYYTEEFARQLSSDVESCSNETSTRPLHPKFSSESPGFGDLEDVPMYDCSSSDYYRCVPTSILHSSFYASPRFFYSVLNRLLHHLYPSPPHHPAENTRFEGGQTLPPDPPFPLPRSFYSFVPSFARSPLPTPSPRLPSLSTGNYQCDMSSPCFSGGYPYHASSNALIGPQTPNRLLRALSRPQAILPQSQFPSAFSQPR